jgi:hypothetical protein
MNHFVRHVKLCMEIDHKHTCKLCMKYHSYVTITNLMMTGNFKFISDNVMLWKLILVEIMHKIHQ